MKRRRGGTPQRAANTEPPQHPNEHAKEAESSASKQSWSCSARHGSNANLQVHLQEGLVERPLHVTGCKSRIRLRFGDACTKIEAHPWTCVVGAGLTSTLVQASMNVLYTSMNPPSTPCADSTRRTLLPATINASRMNDGRIRPRAAHMRGPGLLLTHTPPSSARFKGRTGRGASPLPCAGGRSALKRDCRRAAIV